MSANNWDTCPKCKRKAEQEHAAIIQATKDAYGKLTREDYVELLREAEKPTELEDTLREDWEVGVSDSGQFYVNYRGSCENCGFEFRFTHEEQVNLEKSRGSSS